MSRHPFLIGAALLVLSACGDGGSGPADPGDGQRIAAQFEKLADQIGDSGSSPTADALRHAADVVRLAGHATPATVTIDGTAHDWLAVAEQIDTPEVECTWPTEPGGGIGTPGDSVIPPGGGGECNQTGTHTLRTLIAWEPVRMDQVIRIFADPGSNEVFGGVPDVMAGLPGPSEPGDTGVSGGGEAVPAGFSGEYLLRDGGMFTIMEGKQSNQLESGGGGCTSDRLSFDWAEFTCEAARIRFELDARAYQIRYEPLTGGPDGPEPGDAESHAISLGPVSVDGVRLTVVAWTPPEPPPAPGPGPDPVPGPVDSTTASD